jgi:hypothetical protein
LKLGRIIFKGGLWLSIVLFLSLSALFLCVWTWPGTVVNTKNLGRVTKILAKRGMIIKYGSADLTASSRSFFVKMASFGAKDFCFIDEAMGLQTCFDTVTISASVDIRGWLPKYHLGPAILQGGELTYREPGGKKEDEKSTPVSDEFWPRPPAILSDVSFESLSVELRRLAYYSGATAVEGAAFLTGQYNGRGSVWGSVWTVRTDSALEQGQDRYAVKGEVTLQSADSPWFGPYVIDADLNGELPRRRLMKVTLHGRPRGKDGLDYMLDAFYREGDRTIGANIIGKGDPSGIEGIITGSAAHLAENFPKVAVKECEFAAKAEKKQGKHFTLECPAYFTGYFPRFKNGPYEKILEDIHLMLKSDLRLADRPGKPGSVSGQVELLVDPLIRSIKEGRAAITTNVSGLVADFPHRLELQSDLRVNIPQFERVVEMAQNHPWAIPEPINSLKGAIDLHVTGKGELIQQGGDLPIVFTTRLASEGQSLNLDGQGRLSLKPIQEGFGASLDFHLLLSDVQLALPHLSVEAPPRLAPDRRIKRDLRRAMASLRKAQAAEPHPTSFTYHLQIATPPGQPLHLVSNLAKDRVPITIDLRGTDSVPFNGSVRVLSFPVELFRRTATIRHIDVHLAPDSKASEVSGEIQVVYTDYTIRILILGLLDSPQVRFQSEPPLPEDKVLAVLLFGKTMDDLSADQASSVGSTRAAIENSALSLASMYLLASTPVESVGYDPVSHVFSAKVRLGDGTSLNIGSDMTQLNQIGIRKRLGGHWTITTYLEHPFDAPTITAFLEWVKGY